MDRSIMNSEPKGDFRAVSERDDDYPKGLRELADRPPVLYVKGRWPLPEKGLIGIVGTRRASRYGMDAATRFASVLVSRQMITVSGLAAGIDACAHRATLQEGGWTVAVLGHGFGYQYPKENAPLFAEIAARGTLITEFSYDTRPDPVNFPRRNRIISGLSQGVLVVEAGHRSGASITARYAAEQGRDVFVVPGSIFSPQSAGCHRLIKEGARLVETADEILEEYGLQRASSPLVGEHAGGGDAQNVSAPHPPPSPTRGEGLTSPEQKIMELLSSIPLSVDELVELSGSPVDRLAEVLLSLEIKGRIQHVPGQSYVAKN
jgi:DNA processing protein